MYQKNAIDAPQWLRDKIAQAEMKIKSDPQTAESLGIWYSYKFEGSTYYRYTNLLLSTMGTFYKANGEQFDIYSSQQFYQKFWNEKCCETVLWKGPGRDREVVTIN